MLDLSKDTSMSYVVGKLYVTGSGGTAAGYNPAKSPIGMFETLKIDNDLKMVDTTIREYYGFNNKGEEKNEEN